MRYKDLVGPKSREEREERKRRRHRRHNDDLYTVDVDDLDKPLASVEKAGEERL